MIPTSSSAVRSCAALVLFGITLAGVLPAAPALADQVIGPGREPQVLALFAPSGMGDEVVRGYRLGAVAIRPREIEVSLEERTPSTPPSAPLVVRLVAHDAPLPDGMDAIAESESFVLAADSALAGPQRAALVQLGARVRQNDHGRFWTEVASVQADESALDGAGFGTLALYAGGATLIAAVVLVVLKRRRASKHVQ